MKGMYNFKPVDEEIEFAGGNMRIVGWGNLHLSKASSTAGRVEVELQDVALVLSFDKHLFSISVARYGSSWT